MAMHPQMNMKAWFWIVVVGLLVVVGFSLESEEEMADTETAVRRPEATRSQPVTPTPAIQEVAGVTDAEQSATGQPNPEESGGVLVTRVIDGDTFEIASGATVRLIGIDAPETVHPNKPVECLGTEASAKLSELIEDKNVRLEKDVRNTDRYGRLLRYAWSGDTLINEVLVREGFAFASAYPPDVKHQTQLEEAEGSARAKVWGLWSDVCSNTPSPLSGSVLPSPTQAVASVESAPSSEEADTTTECKVKGNISSEDEKIYHVPGCQSYKLTKINPARGERLFCSEAEAKAAGWRKAKNCS